MKILFVLENYYPNIGGVETLFKSVTEKLVQENVEVTVVTNRYSKDLKKQENINGVDIIRLSLYNRYIFTFFAMFPILKYARKHDIIHTTSYNAGVPAYFAGLLTQTKTIITFHEVWGKLWFDLPYMGKFSLWLHYIFEKFLLKLGFYKFIAVSNATAMALENAGIQKSKIKMIHNGIDYSEFNNVQEEARPNSIFNFLYFGRLGISKGLDIILEGIKLLKKENVDFIFTLIIPKSPVDFHNKILELIKADGLESHIIIRSELPKEILLQLVKNADTVVIPSYSEGFCYSAVETMALDVPIITSGKGSLKEVVTGKHLTLDTLSGEALKNMMLKAMNNEWEIVPISKFHLSDTVNHYIDFYKGILN